MIRTGIIIVLLVSNIFTAYLLLDLIEGYNPDCTGHPAPTEVVNSPQKLAI